MAADPRGPARAADFTVSASAGFVRGPDVATLGNIVGVNVLVDANCG